MGISIQPSRFSNILIAAAALVVAIGIAWSYSRGAPDFRVFYEAGKLVLEGHADLIYRESPDRFLYAPLFAWAMAPLALLPFAAALTLWNGLKLALIYQASKVGRAGLAVGILVWARPVLIDFQYGNINLILCLATFWSVMRSHWFLMGFLGALKLLLLPFWSAALGPRFHWRSAIYFCAGGLIVLLFSISRLHPWLEAIQSRGFPTDTHNQSFLAFIHRFFAGESVHVISLHAERLYTWFVLSPTIRNGLGGIWIAAWLAVWLWLTLSDRLPKSPLDWALLLALVPLPLHLVWKPYFVFGVPLVAQLAMRKKLSTAFVVWTIISAILVNFSSTSFLGNEFSATLEAGSFFLWVHLIWVILGLRERARLRLAEL